VDRQDTVRDFLSVDAQADIITVLALFHHAQDRAAFDPED